MKVLFLSHSKNHNSWPTYLANFFFSLHYAATLYISSSYLENYFSPSAVDLLFIIGSLGNILLFLCAPYLLRDLGNRKFLFFLLSVELFSTLGLAYGWSKLSVGLFFIICSSVISLIYYSLDIFLEEETEDKKTGSVRGSYLTITNFAIALAPFLFTLYKIDNNFSLIYFAAVLLLVPPLALSIFSFHNKKVKPRHATKLILPLKAYFESLNLSQVTKSSFVLDFFYTFMVIYMPIYLNQIIGFDWSAIGIIFVIMLLPFVIFEWPAGILADKLYGEKEIMALGFFIMGLSLISMPFLGKNIVWWALVLFLSRVGASFVEITCESYFFKHVDARDTAYINIYRLTRPASTIIGVGVSALSIYLFSIQISFFVIALIVLWGIKQTLLFEDTL